MRRFSNRLSRWGTITVSFVRKPVERRQYAVQRRQHAIHLIAKIHQKKKTKSQHHQKHFQGRVQQRLQTAKSLQSCHENRTRVIWKS